MTGKIWKTQEKHKELSTASSGRERVQATPVPYRVLPVDPLALGRVNGSVVRVGLLGCGTVGCALIQLVHEQADGIEARTGLRLEITRVAVRNASRTGGSTLPRGPVHQRRRLGRRPTPTSTW